jgi:GT2 family glycosyltransferase
MRVWAIILHYRDLEETRACLTSLRSQSRPLDGVLVVDNGSGDADEWKLPGASVVRTGANLGWPGGNNVGIRHALEAGADRVILFNNDVRADEELVERLEQADKRHPEFGILGPKIFDLDPPFALQSAGFSFNDGSRRGFLNAAPIASEYGVVDIDVVMGCCLWIRREVFDAVGLFDERFFLIHEESEFCLRAQHAGFRVGIVADARVRHRGSQSIRAEERESNASLRPYYDVRNLVLLLSRHTGGGPGRRGRWRSWWEYLLYVYYIHSAANERGDRRTTKAIAAGFADALARQWGPYGERRRILAPIIDRLLRAAGWGPWAWEGSREVPVLPAVEAPGADEQQHGAQHGEHQVRGLSGDWKELTNGKRLKAERRAGVVHDALGVERDGRALDGAREVAGEELEEEGVTGADHHRSRS